MILSLGVVSHCWTGHATMTLCLESCQTKPKQNGSKHNAVGISLNLTFYISSKDPKYSLPTEFVLR